LAMVRASSTTRLLNPARKREKLAASVVYE
jgi:hypothetical protein